MKLYPKLYKLNNETYDREIKRQRIIFKSQAEQKFLNNLSLSL